MKERAAYQAASAGQQSVESNGPTVQPPIEALVEKDKPRSSTGSERESEGASSRSRRRLA